MNKARFRLDLRLSARLAALLLGATLLAGAPAWSQTASPAPGPSDTKVGETKPAEPKPADGKPAAAPASPSTATPPSATPPTPPPVAAPAPATIPKDTSPTATPPKATPEGVPLAPGGKPQVNEIEPNATPTMPEKATTEDVDVPSRPVVAIAGQSSYDEAFKSIKGSLETVSKAMAKAGVKPSGHPITIFSAPDDKGFKYQAGFPVSQKPETADLGDGVTTAMSPAGKAIKFQHRGPYDDIDSTYDVITAFLDAKGLQVDSPYIEEYLTDLTTGDDPSLQVDIYVFVKANATPSVVDAPK